MVNTEEETNLSSVLHFWQIWMKTVSFSSTFDSHHSEVGYKPGHKSIFLFRPFGDTEIMIKAFYTWYMIDDVTQNFRNAQIKNSPGHR